MDETRQIKLIEKFKSLEEELIKLLNIEPIDFEQSSQSVKSKIKTYIKKVEKAKVLFNEYEHIAMEIEKYTSKESCDTSSEIIAMRKQDEEMAQEPKTEIYVDKIEVVDGKQKVTKTKKKSAVAKEF